MADAYKPEWVPENAAGTFATQVMTGVRKEDVAAPRPSQLTRRYSELTARDYVDGILSHKVLRKKI